MTKGIAQYLFPFALALLLLLQPVVPYIEYVLFQDYIAYELCEKRNDNSSQCHGSCWLQKELVKQQNTASESQTTPKLNSKYKALEYDLLLAFLRVAQPAPKASFPTTLCELYIYNYSFATFHPPKFFV